MPIATTTEVSGHLHLVQRRTLATLLFVVFVGAGTSRSSGSSSSSSRRRRRGRGGGGGALLLLVSNMETAPRRATISCARPRKC